ncbi:MAG TPA: IS1634 family transposase [Ktedonobacteraceae bacterium]|nr:IS1634 family transposase [Ktedonobacteraceae bacterium]
MNDPLTIRTERVDDIPLLLAQMQRMGLARLLDAHFPTHGNRQGLSLGVVTTIWLTHILSQADHRMNRVQPWAERRLETLRGCSDATLEVRDLGDDRLADVLRHVSDDERWRAFEGELTGQLVRVYDLRADCVRLDSTTASSYGAVSEDGLLQLGHSKDHRPDLGQLKVMLATLDPLGLPLVTEVLSGERADDPLYLPAITRVRACLNRTGLLYVGDVKMSALGTRASIQAAGDFYLCPLSALQVSAERLAQQVAALRESSQPLLTVERTGVDGQTHGIAYGYQDNEVITAQVEGESFTWTERRLLVRSQAAARAAETALRARLGQVQATLRELSVRRQGKPVLAERAAVEQAVTDTLVQFRVEGLLRVTVSEQVMEQPVRAYRDRPATVRTQSRFTISSQVEPEALASAIEQLGWRVYATNQVADALSLPQAVEAYRDEYLVERNFGRLKGRPLSLSPMYVERDDHATGLVRLLSLALRILTLLEFVVRRHLAQQGASLAGLYAGNPKRATTHPTTERLLEVFQEITLTLVIEPHQTRRHVTALSPLQQRVLALLGFTPTIYTTLCGESSEPP